MLTWPWGPTSQPLLVCFTALRQIRSVRRSLSRHALLTLVHALIVRKVDYCNFVLAGIPGQLQDRLQSVLNAAARLVFSARRSEWKTHCYVSSIGCEFRNESHSSCVFWPTAVFMEQRRRTLLGLGAFSGHLTPTLNVVCTLLMQPC